VGNDIRQVPKATTNGVVNSFMTIVLCFGPCGFDSHLRHQGTPVITGVLLFRPTAKPKINF
jgi:hypothetical protein